MDAMGTEVRTGPFPLRSDLGINPLVRPRRNYRLAWVACAVTVLTIAVAAFPRRDSSPARYVTQKITTGSLLVSVTATGNLEPRNQLDIGTELSGTVRAVHVGVNDLVSAGLVLAELDTSRLEAQVLQAESSLASAQARVVQASARLKVARANQARLLKLRELSGNKLPSPQDLDFADTAVVRSVGEVAAAQAAVSEARAVLKMIRADLFKADIRSPINGVVLVRSVETGQTVAASLRAPVLFKLAEDLKQMELHVAVDEADIGAVNVGQHGTFTVDAFPAQVFAAKVVRIHMASKATTSSSTGLSPQNGGDQASASATAVVTYETVLAVDNAGLTIRPGMTATVEIATNSIAGATLIPNAAMRFTPQGARLPGTNDESERGTGLMALMPYLADRWKCPREGGQALGCVWVLEDGEPALAIFKPGATDRTMTQVLPLERLPNWSSLAHLRGDPILAKAVKRRLTPGVQVIVDSVDMPDD